MSASVLSRVSAGVAHITADVPSTSTRDLRILHMCFASADPDLIDNYRGLCTQFGSDNMPAICQGVAYRIAAELADRS